MNTDLRASLDILNTKTSQHNIVLREEDFVNGEVELTDKQIKQMFMILAQGAVYKKIQGSLKGYTPAFTVDKIDSKEDINEASIFSKMKDAFIDRFGSKGEKMANIARNTSSSIWKQWDIDSVKGGIPSTVEAVGAWIKNKGVDDDLIDMAFVSVGVPNVQNILGAVEPSEPTDEISAVEQWLDDEMLLPMGFTGELTKEFLLSSGVPEDRAETMLKRMGITIDGRIVAKKHYERLNAIVDKFGTAATPQVDSKPPSDKNPTEDWSASDTFKHIINNYDVDEDKLAAAFTTLGTNSDSDDSIGADVLGKLTTALSGKESTASATSATAPQSPDEVMDQTQDILKTMGGTVSGATNAGKKAASVGDYSGMSELQKLGIAILTARKKI